MGPVIKKTKTKTNQKLLKVEKKNTVQSGGFIEKSTEKSLISLNYNISLIDSFVDLMSFCLN